MPFKTPFGIATKKEQLIDGFQIYLDGDKKTCFKLSNAKNNQIMDSIKCDDGWYPIKYFCIACIALQAYEFNSLEYISLFDEMRLKWPLIFEQYFNVVVFPTLKSSPEKTRLYYIDGDLMCEWIEVECYKSYPNFVILKASVGGELYPHDNDFKFFKILINEYYSFKNKIGKFICNPDIHDEIFYEIA